LFRPAPLHRRSFHSYDDNSTTTHTVSYSSLDGYTTTTTSDEYLVSAKAVRERKMNQSTNMMKGDEG
jgi:hypothetical protein